MPSESVLKAKKEIVAGLVEEFRSAQSIVLVDYRGITVEQDTEMRAAARKANVKYKVVKNTLAKFAMKELGYEGIEEFLAGPTAIAMCDDDIIAPAKVMNDFAKKIDCLEIKAAIVEGKVVSVDEVKALAELPSKETLISMLLSALIGNVAGLARAVQAIADKKENEAE